MNAARGILIAVASYSAGANDWRGLAGAVSVASALEAGAFTLRARLRRQDAAWDERHGGLR